MNKYVFVFDITRHTGLTQSLISSAQAHAQSFNAAAVEWFVSPSQQVNEQAMTGTVHRLPDYAVGEQLANRIRELASNGLAGAIFQVYSHSGYVLTQAESLRSPALVVSASTFRHLLRAGTFGQAATHAAGDELSVEAAMELTKQLLAQNGHTSKATALRQFDLRPLLARRDRRANKRWGDPGSVSLIRDIVGRGLSEGWLKRTTLNGQSGTERIWLVPPLPASEVMGPLSAAPASVAAAPEPTVQSVSVPPAEAVPEPSPEKGNKGKVRTQEMVGVLKKAFVYSPSNIRHYAFSAIKEMTAGQLVKGTVAQFIREAKKRAMALATNDGVEFSFWPTAMDAILEMLLRAECLLGPDNSPIQRGLRARGTSLAAIAPDFEDKSDLLLLKILIQKMQLTNKDRIPIAHALFKEGKTGKSIDELLERLDHLFTLLGDEFSEEYDGTIVLHNHRTSQPSSEAVH